MGDAAKMAGDATGFVSLGAFNTNGTGWGQGGDFKQAVLGAYSPIGKKIIEENDKRNNAKVPNSMPVPTWNLTNQETGLLRNDLQLGSNAPKAVGQSQDILNQLQSQAMSKGPSQSAQYLQDANNRNTMNALDDATAAQMGQLSGARNQLAMRGGLDAGSSSRLAKSNMLAGILGQQKIRNDGAGNNLDILAKDEANKQSMMQALPSSLLAQAGFEDGRKQFDISNTLNSVGSKYQADMQAWGANEAAREQAKLANKKGGMLGLGSPSGLL